MRSVSWIIACRRISAMFRSAMSWPTPNRLPSASACAASSGFTSDAAMSDDAMSCRRCAAMSCTARSMLMSTGSGLGIWTPDMPATARSMASNPGSAGFWDGANRAICSLISDSIIEACLRGAMLPRCCGCRSGARNAQARCGSAPCVPAEYHGASRPACPR